MMVSGLYGKAMILNWSHIHAFSCKTDITNFPWEFINSWRKIIFIVVTWIVIKENINFMFFVIKISWVLICAIKWVFRRIWVTFVLIWEQSFEPSIERSSLFCFEIYPKMLEETNEKSWVCLKTERLWHFNVIRKYHFRRVILRDMFLI